MIRTSELTPAALRADLEVAHALADAADRISLAAFRSADLAIETKPDSSLVSAADREIERVIRATLRAQRPDDGVLGEEFGEEKGASGRRWIVDPIDGTTAFLRGVPLYATLIALEGSRPLLGLVSAPALGRRWWGLRDVGAFADGQQIQVSTIARLRDAHVATAHAGAWLQSPYAKGIERIAREARHVPAYGDFWIHALVAEGSCDAAIEVSAARWDLAALQVIVEEAGGRFSDLAGRADAGLGTALSTNGLLHDELLRVLRHDRVPRIGD